MAGSISLERLLADPSAIATSPLVGSYVVGAGNEVVTVTTDGALKQLDVRDDDAVALLTTIDADTGAILSDTNALVVDLAAIEVELLDQLDFREHIIFCECTAAFGVVFVAVDPP